MKFRTADAAHLSPESARRQSDITRLAILLLGRDHAIAFMNAENVALGGCPIDLAVASEDGRQMVEAELARMTKSHARDLSPKGH